MDFPAIQKCYSHVSQRRPSDSSSDHSPDHSPTSSVSQNDFAQDEKALTPSVSRTSRPAITRDLSRITTRGTTMTLDPSFEVDFEDDDPENPRNWSLLYKSLIIFTVAYGTLVAVMYSTSYTTALGGMQREFGASSEAVVTLGVTTYMFGLGFGCLALAPISETYGRKPVYMVSMALFVLFAIPCAMATSLEEIIVVRFFASFFGSAMVANAPGTIADVFSDDNRATAFSFWSLGPMNGPMIGPIVGGFIVEYAGWRWTNWFAMITAGVAFVFVAVIEETYSPVLLQRKAKQIRKRTGDDRYWSKHDVRVGFAELMKVNLSRPFVLMATEPICMFWDVYIGILYGIMYLAFISYPLVFSGDRHWSIGISGLAFIGIGIGSMITICAAKPIRWLINSHKPDAEGHIRPEAMLSVVCIAATLVPIGQLWFAWTCYPVTIHWAWSIASGIPFGCGNAAVFIYASNYMVHSYGIYAASCLAGNTLIRSVFGGTMPLAGPAMYRAMGPNWAGTFLGLLQVVIIPVPFVFYRYGHKIREKSKLIREMRELEERQERKRLRAQEKIRKAQEADAGKGGAKAVGELEIRQVESEKSLNDDRDLEKGDALKALEKEVEAEAVLDEVQGIEAQDLTGETKL